MTTVAVNPLTSTFDGIPVSDGDVLVKYTVFGDADLSGSYRRRRLCLRSTTASTASARPIT
jgi:hypothetical protein